MLANIQGNHQPKAQPCDFHMNEARTSTLGAVTLEFGLCLLVVVLAAVVVFGSLACFANQFNFIACRRR